MNLKIELQQSNIVRENILLEFLSASSLNAFFAGSLIGKIEIDSFYNKSSSPALVIHGENSPFRLCPPQLSLMLKNEAGP